MARSRDFLARFRPVGTPGAAAAAGVPADRAWELVAELGPLLARLADTQAEAEAVRAAAVAEAQRRRRAGDAQVAAVLAAGREQAQAQRSALLQAVRADAEAAASATVDAARAEAAAIDDRVAARLPAMVDRVRATVRAELLGTPAGRR